MTPYQMRDYQISVHNPVARQKFGKLLEPKRRQDTHDIRIMTEVKIQCLVQWERHCVVIQRHIHLRFGGIDGMVLQPREYLLHVSNANGASSRRLKAITACELDIDAVFVRSPFVEGEERAEGRIAESDGFVGAEGLGVVRVFYCPIETWCESAQAGGCVSEVFGIPFYCGIIAACAAEVVAVGAVVVSVGKCKYEEARECSRHGADLPRQRVVPYTIWLFDSKHQRSITSPLKPKETR